MPGVELETQYYWRVSFEAWESYRIRGCKPDRRAVLIDDMSAIIKHTSSPRLRSAAKRTLEISARLAA